MLRQQYHFRRVGQHIHIWNVNKLLAKAQDLPVETISLHAIKEIDEPYWFDVGDAEPTCRAVLHHAQQWQAADLSWPILLCSEGRVMDGMHRVMKAVSLNHEAIEARRLQETPPPDFVDVPADQLPY